MKMKKYQPRHNILGFSPNYGWRCGPVISRRKFLIGGASLATLAALPMPLLAGHDNVRRSRSGLLDTTLRAQRAINRIPQWEVVTRTDNGRVHFFRTFVRDFRVDTRVYEGTTVGPELRVYRGDVLRIKHENLIPEEFEPTGLPLMDVNIPHGFNITNIHTHGFNVPPTCDPPLEELESGELPDVCSDNVLFEIEPGKWVQYQYEIPIDHPDGTFWYHPHKHGSVAFQMMGGMQGGIVIEGPTDQVLRENGVRKDKTFVIQQYRLRIDPDTNERAETVEVESFDDFLVPPMYTVNGELNPVIYIRPGEVQRWRFINAGMSEHVPLQLLNENGDPQPLYQIAADGITLPNPVNSELVFPGFLFEEKPETSSAIFMAAGNRADILVKCDEPGAYQMIKPRFDQGFLEGPIPNVPNLPGEPLTPIPGQEFPIATVICTGLPEKNDHLPSDLGTLSLPTPLEDIKDDDLDPRPGPGLPHRTLIFAIDPTGFGLPFPKFVIGGRYKLDDEGNVVPNDIELPDGTIIPSDVPLQFDPNRIDQHIKEGAVEEWTIINPSPVDHPFHIHQIAFQVIEINDPRLDPTNDPRRTPEDLAKLNETLPRWQDTQNIPGGFLINPETFEIIPSSITIRLRFEGGIFKKGNDNGDDDNDSGNNGGRQSIAGVFVLHCHILDHEDTGMMQLVKLEPRDKDEDND